MSRAPASLKAAPGRRGGSSAARAVFGPLAAASLVALVFVALVTLQQVREVLYRELWRVGEVVAEAAAAEDAAGRATLELPDRFDAALPVERVVVLAATSAAADAAAGVEVPASAAELAAAARQARDSGAEVRVWDRQRHQVVVTYPVGTPGKRDVVAVWFDTRAIEDQVAGIQQLVAGALLLLGMAIVGLCLLLTNRRIARPLGRLERIVEAARTDPDAAAAIVGAHPFENLASEFGQVLRDLADAQTRAEAALRELAGAREEMSRALSAERRSGAAGALYQDAFEVGAVGIVLFDRDFLIIDANPTACELTGYALEDLKGMHKTALVHPEDMARERALLASLADGRERGFDFQRRGLHSSGAVYHVLSRVRAIEDPDTGEIDHYVAFLTDLSDTRRQQGELRAAMLRQESLLEELGVFRYVFESNLVGMSISSVQDPRGRVNGKYCEITGYSPAELRHLSWRELTHPEDFARAEAVVQAALDGSRPEFSEQLRFLRKDGETVNVQFEGRCQRGPDGAVQWFAVVAQDVTDRCRAEAERASALESLQHLLATIPDAVVELDGAGQIRSANASFMKMFGCLGEDAEQKVTDVPITRFLPNFDFASLGEVRFDNTDTHGLTRDGQTLEVGFSCKRRESADGDLYTLIIYDNAMNKRLIEQLEVARDDALSSARVKAAFLANMSHELRTPLNGVLGMLGLLRSTDPTAEQQDYINTAIRSGEHLLTIINDLLDFSKLEAQQVQLEQLRFDPRLVIEDVAELLAGSAFDRGVELAQIVTADVPGELEGDPGRLRQILINLVGNAVKFTNEGEVVVAVSRLRRESARESTFRLQVRDSGVGIPEAMQQRIFESFVQGDSTTTRNFGGTGLGLSITRQLVELMGGTISVASVPGEGATFTVDLPFAEPADSKPREAELAGLHVLGCIPVEAPARSAREILTHSGAELTVREDTAGVRAALQRAHSAGVRYDAIVLDLGIGTRETRAVLAALAGAGYESSCVLAMIAPGYGAEYEAVTALGLGGFLRKPLKSARMRALISATARGRASPSATDASAESAPRSAHVLAVDDVAVNLKVVSGMLAQRGHRVDTAASGEAALAALADSAYDLVLLDCQMPGMDGPEVTRILRAREGEGRRTPVIAMTAATMPEDRAEFEAAGMDGMLPKPVRGEVLDELLAVWVEGRAAAPGGMSVPLDEDDGPPVALVDRRKVEEIASMLGSGAFAELVEMFEAETKVKLTGLEAALVSRDLESAVHLLHSLKGASRNIGALALGDLSAELETAAREGRPSVLDERAGELTALAQQTLHGLTDSSSAPVAEAS